MMLSAVLFLSLISQSFGGQRCFCIPVHPQTAYCKSDFVFKATVTSTRKYKLPSKETFDIFQQMGMEPPEKVYYQITIQKVYKGENKITALNDVSKSGDGYSGEIHMNSKPEDCGSEFLKGKVYLFTGKIMDAKLYVHQCDWRTEWRMISDKVVEGLSSGFDCSCPIATCLDGNCDLESSCKWNIKWDEPVSFCSLKFRSCRKQDGGCRWKEMQDYNICVIEHVA